MFALDFPWSQSCEARVRSIPRGKWGTKKKASCFWSHKTTSRPRGQYLMLLYLSLPLSLLYNYGSMGQTTSGVWTPLYNFRNKNLVLEFLMLPTGKDLPSLHTYHPWTTSGPSFMNTTPNPVSLGFVHGTVKITCIPLTAVFMLSFLFCVSLFLTTNNLSQEITSWV